MGGEIAAIREALATLFPVACGGCQAADSRICRDCLDALREAVSPQVVTIQDALAGSSLNVTTAMPYAPVLRAVLESYKERGRVDLARELSALLRLALREHMWARSSSEATLLIPVPSRRAARARRGYDHIQLLLERAVPKAKPVAALKHVRKVADQSSLGRDERAANLNGAFVASEAVRGRRCLIVDDLVTTGATLSEAARALRAVDATVIGAVAIARVERRYHMK
ncbi:MAG: ComF family protein [Gulosibacter sp.]|uniref:ComF family protein n=1 Tax=Gulosibacter sp. TaxID=2817531 RepID=UPI003F9032D8